MGTAGRVASPGLPQSDDSLTPPTRAGWVRARQRELCNPSREWIKWWLGRTQCEVSRPSFDKPKSSLYSEGPSRNEQLFAAPPSIGLVRRLVSPGPRKELGNQRESWETLNSGTAGDWLLQGSQAYLWQQLVPTWSHCPQPPEQNTHCFPANMPSSQLVLLEKAGELTVTLPASRKEGLPRALSGRWGWGRGALGPNSLSRKGPFLSCLRQKRRG